MGTPPPLSVYSVCSVVSYPSAVWAFLRVAGHFHRLWWRLWHGVCPEGATESTENTEAKY